MEICDCCLNHLDEGYKVSWGIPVDPDESDKYGREHLVYDFDNGILVYTIEDAINAPKFKEEFNG
jgi:hypothetical protein